MKPNLSHGSHSSMATMTSMTNIVKNEMACLPSLSSKIISSPSSTTMLNWWSSLSLSSYCSSISSINYYNCKRNLFAILLATSLIINTFTTVTCEWNNNYNNNYNFNSNYSNNYNNLNNNNFNNNNINNYVYNGSSQRFTDYLNCARQEIEGLSQEPSRETHGYKIKVSASPDRYVPGELYTIVLQGDPRPSKLLSSSLSGLSGTASEAAASALYSTSHLGGVGTGPVGGGGFPPPPPPSPSSSSSSSFSSFPSSSSSSLSNSQKFTEFVLYVVPKEYSNRWTPHGSHLSQIHRTFDVGSFQPQVYTDSLVKLSKDCPNAVTHTTSVPKNEISVMWLSPSQGSGCVIFKALVVESKDRWFHEDGGLTKVICEEDTDTNDEQTEIVDECCACDEAKYEVTFEGYWSKYTHPKDFPASAWQTHFSDIIGASHSADFRIWEYGGYASEGVKQVAESGITKKLESELKAESSKIRTIIKARGLWYPNLNGKTFAVFRVDNRHHLMSLLSMLGPSPDWFIGVSALELCLKNCSWVADKMINLYLWDAGTDSGVTYLSRDLPTIPQERIRRITSTSPNLSDSPFYDPTGAPMKPFARLTISRQRIYEKVCGDEDSRYGISDFDEDDNRSDCLVTEWTVFGPCSVSCGYGTRKRTRNYMNEKRAKEVGCNMKLIELEECGGKCVSNVSCETTAWSEWQPCNVTCGKGYRVRTRKFMHRFARKICHNVELEQREPCMGPVPNCNHQQHHQQYHQQHLHNLNSQTNNMNQNNNNNNNINHHNNNNDMEVIEPHCAVTAWSEWTPCLQDCGKSHKHRNRLYIDPYKSKNVCNVELIQVIGCFNKPCPTHDEDPQSICPLPKVVGPCRGYFPRFYYDSKKGACISFIYRGCRGNKNNFERLIDCKETCENYFKGLTNDDMKYGNPAASSMNPNQYNINNNHHYNQFNQSMTSPLIGDDQNLAIDCVVTSWSEWSQCSRPCGKARKERRREIKLNPQNGGRKCPKLVQRRKCKENPPCECAMSQWSEWSACEDVGCNGNGFRKRYRNITQYPDPGRPPCGAPIEHQNCVYYTPCYSSSTSPSP